MKVSNILRNVVGNYGLSSSNKYQVSIAKGTAGLLDWIGLQSITDPSLFELDANGNRAATKLSYLCDECNIPGFSFSTGDVKGLNPGINIRHAHTKVFNELSLTFILDMTHLPFNVFQRWSDYIFNRSDTGSPYSPQSFSAMRYYDDYCADIIIDKLEPNRKQITKIDFLNADGTPSTRSTHSVVNRIVIKNAFPYSMNNLSFSNGPNQPVRLQVSFYYEYLETVKA